jgi:hypothetical protein
MAPGDLGINDDKRDGHDGTVHGRVGPALATEMAVADSSRALSDEPDRQHSAQHRALTALVKALARQAVAEALDAGDASGPRQPRQVP